MKHILFIILLFIIASCSTNNAHAQFGLFDTVWTIKNQGTRLLFTSKNDSLSILYEEGPYLFHLINTLDKSIIWTDSWNPYGFINDDSCIIFHGYLTVGTVKFENLIIKNTYSLKTIDSIAYNENTLPYRNCLTYFRGISEIDNAIFYSGYCNTFDIKGISYKVNYKTGQARITSDSLPYFAMTISEDGQYVAGVYYTGGTAINDPYNEVIEVRKISDYSIVFRESRYRQDYDPNFAPYQWVTKYKFRFSKDNKFLALNYGFDAIAVYNLEKKDRIFFLLPNVTATYCAFSSNNNIIFLKNFNYLEKEQLVGIYNCETEKYRELEFPNKANVVTGLVNDLIFDKYLLNANTYSCNTETGSFHRIGDVVLLGMNFDFNTIKVPDNPIQGTLYPNPTNMNLTLKLQLLSPIALSTTLHNTEGSLIKDYRLKQYEQGENTLYFNVSELLAGNYFLKLSGERFSQIYKVIINR